MIQRTRLVLLAGGLLGGGAVAAMVATASLPGGSAAAGAAGAPAVAQQSLPAAYLANSGSAGRNGTRWANGLSATGPVSGTVPGPGWGGFGMRGPKGGFGAFGRGAAGLTVTAVNGNTITATRWGNQSVTVQVSATTAYTEAGASASLSDVTVGAHIAVQGSRASANSTTINATGVTIVLPQEAGVVTAVNGSTLTLTGLDGRTWTVALTGSTRYQKAGQSAASSDVTTGTAVVVEGTQNSDGSLTAVRVAIQLPRIGGQVATVNGTSITLQARGGITQTVTTSGSTTYVNPDGSTAAASAVKAGAFIMAEGTLSSDGKTLAAQRITVIPAGKGPGFGGRHGFGGRGRHGGFGMGAPNGGMGGAAPTSPSTSSTGATF